MSLAIDTIFIEALSENSELMERLGQTDDSLARIYGTAIPLPDEDALNADVPYIIVGFDGLTNDSKTKDEPYEGEYDQVSISVEITANNLNELHELTQTVRDTILNFLREYETPIADYQFSAQAIQYDSIKPCYWQVLNYLCDTNNAKEYE